MTDERDPLLDVLAHNAARHDVSPERAARIGARARRAFVAPSRRTIWWSRAAGAYRSVEPTIVIAGSAIYLAWCFSVVLRYF